MKVNCPNINWRPEAGGRRPGFRVQGSGEGTANCKLQIANCKLLIVRRIERNVAAEQSLMYSPGAKYALDRGNCETASGFARIRRSAFTLIELLVTITIIGILAGISLGAIRYARIAAAEGKTKATIAKINALAMQRYESYMTRRVPIDFNNLTFKGNKVQPKLAATLRYCAILDIMRMEMPERTYDIINGPLNIKQPDLDTGTLQPWTSRPALSLMYIQRFNNKTPVDNCRPAKYLYMWISMTYPEAMSQFGGDEIKDLDGDGWPVFIDGWGNPIMFLRWAPGFLPPVCNTEVQTGDAVNDHDPFDSRRIYAATNYRLIPLIYSAGPDQAGHDVNTDKKYGIISEFFSTKTYYNIDFSTIPTSDTLDKLDPFWTNASGKQIGSISDPTDPDPGVNRLDNIHNHRIEQQ
jgi:prepilin-type N-terminal cleavage/methylation domain-containing protein